MRLTCEHYDFNQRNPGYVYWNRIHIEHLGPMGDDWCDNYPEKGEWAAWCHNTIMTCLHLEQLQIPVNAHTFLQSEWFEMAQKKEDLSWFDYFVYLGDFYLRGEAEIAFLETIDIGDNNLDSEFIVHIWNRDTKRWTMEQYISICPDVEYHEMHKHGYQHGCKFWGEKSHNIISHSYFEICACFGWYKLPEQYPYLKK